MYESVLFLKMPLQTKCFKCVFVLISFQLKTVQGAETETMIQKNQDIAMITTFLIHILGRMRAHKAIFQQCR
ncbi:hypothetical protein XENTR_v10001845 [Xenopus tropicalis]|nr:hypothetical protein XENTR_v10001845 [Xenopus tropicalis]